VKEFTMPDNHPRAQLCFIFNKYGRSIIDDPRHCRSLLTELAPQHRLEISLLITALGQQIAQELLKPTSLIPVAKQLELLAQRLHDHVGIQLDFAYWSVESWALALKVIHQPMPKQTVQYKPKASPTPPKTTKIIPSSPVSQQSIRKSITQKALIENSNIPAELIRAVVKQSSRGRGGSGWAEFTDSAADVVGGHEGCNSGFIYYSDTIPFARKNKRDILSYATAQAAKKNLSPYELFADLKYIKEAEISPNELAKIINRLFRYEEDESSITVFNCLAWFALEECAREWVDINSKVYPPVSEDTPIGNTP
jgi:hypothetical protein